MGMPALSKSRCQMARQLAVGHLVNRGPAGADSRDTVT